MVFVWKIVEFKSSMRLKEDWEDFDFELHTKAPSMHAEARVQQDLRKEAQAL